MAIPEIRAKPEKPDAYLTRQLAGFHVVSSRETGSKATRAMPLASQVEAGNVSIVEGDWNRTLLDEMCEFPWGRKDDQVDALVRGFTTLTMQPRRPYSIPTRFLIADPLLKPESGTYVRYTLRSGPTRQ